ncbi:MAG: TRAP transporter large permease subunit [Arenimonas sp.]
MSMETQQIIMLLLLVLGLLAGLSSGFPVAFVLGGVALLAAGTGMLLGNFDPSFLEAFPNRIFGTINNATLMAVPLFVFMGIMLEKSRIAENLLEAIASLFGAVRGGLVVAVIIVGAILAASTGIVGATVVAMGLISLPTMLRHGYDPKLATGAICASGTLGQIIPPSLILVLLGDQLGNAYQQAQLKLGNFSPDTISVGDLFAGAIIPGLGLVALYLIYVLWVAWRQPSRAPAMKETIKRSVWDLCRAIIPALGLILAVLGSILFGIATPTEAAAVGAVGALLFALIGKQLSWEKFKQVSKETAKVTGMVFAILIGAALFSLVFRGYGGDDLVHHILSNVPGGKWGALFVVMLVMFVLGFMIDFIEIIFVVVPIVAPALLAMGVDPVWLGVVMAINLQTSFLTPPFGFALFYLRGVAPPEVKTIDIYRGVIPFIALQVLMLLLVIIWPELATWLPGRLNG